MIRFTRLFRRLAGVCLIVLSGAAVADEEARQRARDLIDHLDVGRYADAVALFAPPLAEAMPAEQLHVFWASLPALYGQRLLRGTVSETPAAGGYTLRIPLTHEQATLLAEVGINSRHQIVSFALQPQMPPPHLVHNEQFSERTLEIPLNSGSLPATLTQPAGPGPFPGVVLVHGAGPHDRDESIGNNRPFRDLAHGLAARGIAVLRYDKRSRIRPADYAGEFTVDDETTDDAVAALKLLADQAEIGPLFIFGHSQGAMLAPRIAARAGIASGAVLWATQARPVVTALVEQLERIAASDGDVDADEKRLIDDIAAGLADIRAGVNPPRSEAPLQLPAGYWRSLEAIAPVDEAKQAKIPLLLLHGGRDYQVTDADWHAWTTAFADDGRATLLRFPALNHIGIAGDAPSQPAEYFQAGRVDQRLIDAAADWIRRQATP